MIRPKTWVILSESLPYDWRPLEDGFLRAFPEYRNFQLMLESLVCTVRVDCIC